MGSFITEKSVRDDSPVSWSRASGWIPSPGACRAGCNIDVETVRRLGDRLVVTDNIRQGAPLCRFVITRLQTPDRRYCL